MVNFMCRVQLYIELQSGKLHVQFYVEFQSPKALSAAKAI